MRPLSMPRIASAFNGSTIEQKDVAVQDAMDKLKRDEK